MNKDVLEKNVETLIEAGGEPPRISDGARARIRAELVHRFGVVEAPRSPVRFLTIAFAMSIALALLLGRHRAPPHATATLADGSTYIAQPGARVAVTGPRHVRVAGAVLLDVAPGKGTFVVDTARGRIEVLGTRFLVDGEAERTVAAVLRGEVKLVSDLGSVILHAGDQGIAEPGHPPVRSPAPRLSHLVSWAREARAKAEKDLPIHHGTLFARDPGVRSHPPWGHEYPLPLEQLTVDVQVEDQIARVALDQTFHNDQPQDLEGVYRFAIPPDAALQRLAMYVDGKLEESAVVERMQARRIYEELVYRRVDPALLEWAGTGRLDLRVYPLRAQQDKRLMLAYTQSLPRLYDDWTLTVPLPEVDQPVGSLDVAVHVKGCASCEITSTSHQVSVERAGDDAIVHVHQKAAPVGDSFVLHVRDPRTAATVATHSDGGERYLLVRAPAELGGKPAEYRPRTWVVLDDVSASRQPGELRAQADVIDALARELDENDKIAVIAFDVEARLKLPPTRVLDVDRRALREALKGEGGVGATDIGAALDAAVKLAGDGGNVIYLGDGVITSGARTLDTLRAQLGTTHFIGVGIGDAPDTQTLDALAAASGGYATTIDLADDLGWRTFDLVAALHTQRVTGLSARLVDAAGAPIAATAYLRSPQLADGEEIELVAKLASAGTPAAVELTGTLDGTPWTRRIELPPGHDGGYLPRLWAQRHIAARLLAKHEPAPPCAGEPCPTEAQRREDRDEQIRREVVALGKKYFLLSRHTSLLVLENDDMYKQYGVAKGAGDTWAPYAMPATIPVVTTPAAPSLDDDAVVLRAPLQVFYDYGQYYWNEQQMDVAGFDGRFGLAEDRTRATSGIGWGYGRGDLGTITLAENTKGVREHAKDIPVASTAEASLHAALEDRRDIVVAGQPIGGALAGPVRVGGEGDFKAISRWGVLGSEIGGTFGGLVSPIHFTYPTDVAFDDVSAFVPALIMDRFDELRAALGTPSEHAIDDAATALLARARAALPPGTYRWGAYTVSVDGAHRIGWRRTTDTGLDEVASFDGTTWLRRYGELDLDVTRTLAADDIALALAYLPIWIAEPAHYARYFDVKASGRDVVLSRDGTAVFTLSFDDHAHLVAVRDANHRVLVSVTWGAGGPTAARAFGEDLAVSYSNATTDVMAGTTPGALVTLPAHLAMFWGAELAHLAVGSPAWRVAQRQKIVAAAAAGNRQLAFQAYEALRLHGGVQLGDLVLASGGIATATTDEQQLAALAPLRDQPLARYLAATRAYGKSPSPDHLAPVVAGGLVGNLWALRSAVAELAAGHAKTAVDRIAAITGVELRAYGAAAVSARYDLKADELVRAWQAVETGRYVNIARAQAAVALYNRGQYEAAADQITRLVDNLDLHAAPAQLASAPSMFAQSRRGAAGWALVWAKLRDTVLAGASYDHALALVPLAAQHPEDLQRVLARAAELAGADAGAKAALARLAAQYGQAAWAEALIRPLLATAPTHELYQLAGQLALAQGRAADALADLEAAQDAPGDATVDAATLRAEMSQLLAVARQVALSTSGAARDKAVRTALHWGNRWRAVDPGNSAIDQALGELLLAVGDSEGAWRQLSGTIERDPWSGAGYMTVADAFERQGKVEASLAFWQQAIVIDQTNPTPRLRKAQALIALGRTAEGDALLHDIADHTWHDIWSNVVYQAKDLLARSKPR